MIFTPLLFMVILSIYIFHLKKEHSLIQSQVQSLTKNQNNFQLRCRRKQQANFETHRAAALHWRKAMFINCNVRSLETKTN